MDFFLFCDFQKTSCANNTDGTDEEEDDDDEEAADMEAFEESGMLEQDDPVSLFGYVFFIL